MKRFAKRLYSLIDRPISVDKKILEYKKNGSIPWTNGYKEYKWQQIVKVINNSEVLSDFRNNKIISPYGIALDERIVEYPWIFAHLQGNKNRLLDAGSTLNFKEILNNDIIKNNKGGFL